MMLTRFLSHRDTRSRRANGFSLLELLVVLAIMALIATIVAPRVMRYLGSAKSETAKVQMESLASALDLFRLETGRYPTTQEGLSALIKNPNNISGWNGPYLDQPNAIEDPWDRPYLYAAPGETKAFDLSTLGADGQQGGEGEDADIRR
jgi:general secretion pathway protein G